MCTFKKVRPLALRNDLISSGHSEPVQLLLTSSSRFHKYFLGRAELDKGVQLEPLVKGDGGNGSSVGAVKQKFLASLGKYVFRGVSAARLSADDLSG